MDGLEAAQQTIFEDDCMLKKEGALNNQIATWLRIWDRSATSTLTVFLKLDTLIR